VYTPVAGDDAADVAAGLAAEINKPANAALHFKATADGSTLLILDTLAGSTTKITATLDIVGDALGDDRRVRYLMGVGSPPDFFTAVERGIDLFDCVLPTRVARNGQLWTWDGRLNLRNARFLDDDQPVDTRCRCETCQTFSRAYLAHLFRAEELLAYRLASLHNLTFTLDLLAELRTSLANGTFVDLGGRIMRAYAR